MKICINCKIEKPLDNFYKHKGMFDGLLNKCIDCCKQQSKEREDFLRNNDKDWLEREKERAREKYYRLGMNWKKPTTAIAVNRSINYRKNFPEKYAAKIKSQRLPKINKSNQLHHWSYNEEHYRDCIELNIKEHNLIHRFLIYDQEYMKYRTLENILLESKEDHLNYINNIISNNL
jgi:hypothetical protein